eukprot:gnl/MRDRNA2_/MRDRNA2_111331_c0_seq1.p1 gnl/MRDRNA2_/MRDRNA2_111331_c0~~gnl/MRDRNA2_/MRDRNA2_111331_c0_seq1.p1  ORF type:complete len:140 (+),score=34.44 gnl/MRDRNA2_/MRDRNA2_111331_c0_seq1:94-513(+)
MMMTARTAFLILALSPLALHAEEPVAEETKPALSKEQEAMIDAIFKKFSNGKEYVSQEALGELISKTHPEESTYNNEGDWESLSKQVGFDPTKGLTKEHLTQVYLASEEALKQMSPGSENAIEVDYKILKESGILKDEL